jgi:serine/threonine-protein kinase
MAARFDRTRLATESGSSWPEDHVWLARRRLAVAASLTAAVHALYIVLYETVWAADNDAVAFGSSIAGLIVSVAVAGYLFSGARGARALTVVGVGYEVLLAFLLGLSDSATLNFSAPSQQVSWGAVVIVFFPFLIPAAPRVVLTASMVAAAMTPATLGLMFAIEQQPWPAAPTSVSLVLPPFVCALLAWAPTNVLHRLRSAVWQARRLGNYELSERLGAGGMGEVWRARHRLLARPAAVKLIKPEVLGARDAVSRELLLSRFEQEARVTASLDSPHTVELYDFGVSADGELFIVMELLDGLDTETLVERFGPLPSERVAHLLMQACDSLEDAHRRGLIHRDVKPANLFVARKGVEFDFLKVLDFGLVKRWQSGPEATPKESLVGALAGNQTALGQIVGTPAFLAPEAVTGNAGLDQRADIYALGCVGYWLLTGRMVFEDPTVMGVAVAHVTREPEPPSARIAAAIAPELERLVLACLAKDPAARPASARSLREQLASIRFDAPWSRQRATAWWHEHLRAPALTSATPGEAPG